MNKLFTKIVGAALGLTMAIGVGVAVASNRQDAVPVHAATADAYYQFTSKSWASKLNTDAYGSSGTTKNWSGTADGNQLTNNQGVQITKTISTSTVTCPDTYNSISSIAIRYCTNASSGVGSLVAKVGSTTGSPSSFSVTKPSSGGTTLKDATFTFSTPVTGTPIITANCTTNSVFVFGVHVTYTASSSAELTGLRIASGTPNKLYEPGDSFDGTGLTIYASWDDEEDTSKNVLSDVVWNGGSALSAGSNQTITGYHTDDTNDDYPIQVTGVDVVNADFTHTKASNSIFGSDTADTTNTVTHTPTSGPEFITLGGYNWSSGYMSLKNVSGMYVGNNEAYSKYIRRVVIKLKSGDTSASAIKVYEGPTALSESTEVAQQKAADNITLTYDFSDTNQFFKIKSTSATYINMDSLKVFLGSTPVTKIVDEVTIGTPASVYVGKSLPLSATVSYTNAVSDNKVTWAVTSGNGGTVNSSTGVFSATAATATTITATSVEKDAGGDPVSASVTITPLANRITAVAWNTSGAKKSYNIGDPLDISNITATGTNEAGDDDVELTLTTSNFSGFDSSAAVNSQTITISYPNEINPGSPFTTTYTISVVATPDVYIQPSDFASGGYDVNNDGLTFNGIDFDIYKAYQNSGGIQIAKLSDGGQFHNVDELGQYITSVEISVKTNSINVYLGTSELTTNSGSQAETIASGDGVTTITPDSNTYQYIRFSPTSAYCVLNYIKIWYAPFVPAVTLDGNSSYEFTEGDTGDIVVNATAAHFTNNSGVVFSAASSDTSVLTNGNISVSNNTITINKANVNPGTTTVTVTGTYSTASEEATASFTIVCDAAARNLESIAITTPSSDTEFEAGAKFTITNLVVTGTFDAAPLTADVTSECTFKLWDGENETAVTPGASTLSAGSYTVRVSHPSSAAAEVLTYSISVVSPSNLTVTQSVIGSSFGYTDTNESSLDVSLNAQLTSTVDLESYGLYKNGTNIQMNSGKGTYIKNTIAVPGKILRIEMDWASGTDKNTPTIYFGDSYYSSKPTVGGTQATAGSSNSVSSDGNCSYFYLDGTTVSGSCQMSEMRVIYIATVEGEARNFADKYLYMNTYDQGGSHGSTNGSGYCKDDSDQHYYSDAKTAYGKLTTEQKNEFAKLTAAVTRMQDWATANGETFDPSAKTFTQNSKAIAFSIVGESANVSAIIIIVSLVSLTAIGGYFFIRKRKEQ